MKKIIFKPIGIIHTPFKEAMGTPIQPRAAQNIEGVIEIYPDYQKALMDLDGFSHIILLYHFHLAKKWNWKVKPYMDHIEHGLFATRAPTRPNPIGLSVVNLIRIEHEKLFVKGTDIIDSTPLLDIKPYVSDFDYVKNIKIGWLEHKIKKLAETKDDNRFIE